MTSSPLTSSSGTRPRNEVGWRPLLAKAFLVVLVGQVVGFAVGITSVTAAGLLASVGFLVDVVAGAITGTALGLLLLPRARQLPGYAAISAAVGVVVVSALLALGSLRAGADYAPSWPALAAAVGLTVATQTVLASALWALRGHREPGA